MKPKRIECVSDLAGGEIVKVGLGWVRIINRPEWGGERFARLLDDDLREVKRGHVFLRGTDRVLEVREVQAKAVQGGETDPLKGGL